MSRTDKIKLDGFYPENLKITKITEEKNQIIIELKSQKHSHKCRKCGEEMTSYHATYRRTVQDLPILGKQVILKITAYKYYCKNEECGTKSCTEDYDDFIGKSKRMTSRCEELIKTIAVETSCESAAKICGEIGIKVSGDTIIGMLKKEAEKIKIIEKPERIISLGVDDFAYRKGRTYCIIVCDGESHRPIEVLEGRDGESLKEWLRANKKHMNVTKVTRDRANAYAKVISEIIPGATQIADRFHLHQNFLGAVKEALKTVIPNEIPIPNDCSLSTEDNSAQKLDNNEVADEAFLLFSGESEDADDKNTEKILTEEDKKK